jgi:lysozyme
VRLSADGVDLIHHFEGCRLKAYRCPAGVLTIGWGHTGDDVRADSVWTQQQADEAFTRDIERYERGVLSCVTVALQQHQFDALVSFAYNCGLGNLRGSTLLAMLNRGDFEGAAGQFIRWISKGKPAEKGLTKRRKAETLLFRDMEWRQYDDAGKT